MDVNIPEFDYTIIESVESMRKYLRGKIGLQQMNTELLPSEKLIPEEDPDAGQSPRQ